MIALRTVSIGQSRQRSPRSADLRKLPPARAVAKTLKGTQGNIFFIKRPAAMSGQFGAGQADQTPKIAIPEALDVIVSRRT